MRKLKYIFITSSLIIGFNAISQIQLPVPRNILRTYSKQTRSTDGIPGENYWQNTADYSINVNFNPATREIKGTVDISYLNNSPDTLDKILFKLYPNLYKKGFAPPKKVDTSDLSEGIDISSMAIDGEAVDIAAKSKKAGTNMVIDIRPLPSKQSMHFLIHFSYTLNKTSHIRTGQVDEGSYFIAYFFPRIAVYDDVDGWNKIAYDGDAEFYNDFCHFKVNITVPDNYVVWATGDLLNRSDVLNKPFCDRLSMAENNDAITTIIDTTDLQQGNITINRGSNAWLFEANEVSDFVFATSDHYIWKSSSLVVDKSTGRRTRVDAAFNPVHRDFFEVIDFARATVKHMSYDFPAWPFPYQHETIFDGLDQMEYPMMVNDNPLDERVDAIELTDHEIFHTMFPFYMGINETKYGWMDEGWATIGEWLISPMIDSTIVDEYGVVPYENYAGEEGDLPIKTLTSHLGDGAYFLNCYPKPAFGYLYVKDMLGDELFTKALHFYIEKWHGKHPMPYDFFNCMNKGAGKNLNWFWQSWFFDDGVPDLAITTVKQKENSYTVIVTSKGSKPVPIDLIIYFEDGTTQKMHRNISVWENGNATVALSFAATKMVKKLELGSTYNPDINHLDNIYEVK